MNRTNMISNRKKKSEMFKTYVYGSFRQLEEETRALSLLAARYEVLCVYSMNRVTVKVRCRKGSKVHQLCQQFGYHD